MAIDYVKTDTTKLRFDKNKKAGIELLWGDRVDIIGQSGSYVKVKARGFTGYVKKTSLGGESLLEVYFIDVGQGDGVLIRTPDHKHILIDGGWARKRQDTGKNAADFVDWKFRRDYRKRKIELDAMITSHNDADHYGGLWDLLNPEEKHELGVSEVAVEAFYHAGISWWKNSSGKRWLGKSEAAGNGNFFTQLLGDRNSLSRAIGSGRSPKLQGEWGDFMECVHKSRKGNGSPTPVRRLSHVDDYVPGFSKADGDVSLKILAPVEYEIGGRPAIRNLGGGNSQNTNGNSLLLRLDYHRSRILLTGDLNTRAQQALLADYEGARQEFQCDVAKACHHGSDDVSYEFLAAMRPAVTVISSGDNEGHDHPRPGIIAASATTGYLKIEDDDIVTPLIYSTELARSVRFGDPESISLKDSQGQELEITGAKLNNVKVSYKETMSGGKSRKGERSLGKTNIVSGLIYGLVNIRTDGNRILCATMNEGKYSWKVKKLNSRF